MRVFVVFFVWQSCGRGLSHYKRQRQNQHCGVRVGDRNSCSAMACVNDSANAHNH